MQDGRCECGKLIFQINGNDIFIKCRHCKRMVVIHTDGLNEIEIQETKKIIHLSPKTESRG